MARNPATTAYLIMAALMLARLFFAAVPPLGVDETYAVAAARGFSLSFFDHPPVAFNAALLSSVIVGVETPFVFRIPTLLFGAVALWMMWRIGCLLGGERVGLWTVALYAASPAFALSGSFIVPDAPLNMAAAICVYWLVRIAQSDGPAPLSHWVWVGLALALALASKYQAALIPVMALVFALFTRTGRRWFAQPGPYVASILGLVGLLPVLLWNIANDWASFSFHTGRTGDGINLDNFALMQAGQILYLLPPIAVLAVMGLWRTATSRPAPTQLLLWLIAMGPIVLFNIVYLFSNKSFPHWTMLGWMFALILTAQMIAGGTDRLQRRARAWVSGVAIVVFGAVALLAIHLQTGVLTRFTHDRPPAWDRTWDAFDYSDLRGELEARDLLDGVGIIAARSWIQAAYMSTALQGEYAVKILRGSPHHFPYLEGADATGPALLLTPDVLGREKWSDEKLLELARATDPNAELLKPIVLQRGGLDYVSVSVIRMSFDAR